jgi:hypothetical protein
MVAGTKMPNNQFIQRACWTSATLGLVGAILVTGDAWGLGASLLALALAAGLVYMSKTGPLKLSRSSQAFGWTAVAFALMLSWRDAPELRFLNALTVFLLLGLAILRARVGNARELSIIDITWGIFASLCYTASEGFLVFGPDRRAAAQGNSGPPTTRIAVARGVFVSLPLVFVFGGLLYSADASFENLVRNAFNFEFDFNTLFVGLLVFFSVALGIAGVSRRFFLTAPQPAGPPPPVVPYVLAARNHQAYRDPKNSLFGTVEVAIILGTLNVLFLTFVVLQLPYLFGGLQHAAAKGFTVANYARRGFFELATVVGLVIPTLIALYASLRDRSPKTLKIIGPFAGLMVLLMVVVLASAAQRMNVYVDIYGLSRLRIYVAAAMVWMGFILVWFAATTVRGKPQRFAFGPVVAFLLVLFGLNAISPDATVAAFNTQSQRIANVDPEYLGSLSADATPTLMAALPRMPKAAQGIVYESRRNPSIDSRQWGGGRDDRDWRSLNLSRIQSPRFKANPHDPTPQPLNE